MFTCLTTGRQMLAPSALIRCLAVSSFLAGATTGCLPKKPAGARVAASGLMVGGYRGLAAVQKTISNRLLTPDSNFKLDFFLGDQSEGGLSILMGSYDGELKNAQPNPVNTLLWKITMSGAAENMAERICKLNGTGLNSDFVKLAAVFCPEVRPPALPLIDLWQAVLMDDAPQAAAEAWLTEIQAELSKVAAPEEQGLVSEALLSDLLASLFMHPYFLLAQ